MDCGGKFQMDKFMRLCEELEIPHLVIHDIDDEKKEFHKKANQNIQDAKNANTKEIFSVDPDVEKPLAILEFLAEDANRSNAFLKEVSQFLLRYV
jgi:predicted ATP-dependent endonuclease of OLD family